MPNRLPIGYSVDAENEVWRPTTFTYVVWPAIAAVLLACVYFSLGELGAFFVGTAAGIALCLEFG